MKRLFSILSVVILIMITGCSKQPAIPTTSPDPTSDSTADKCPAVPFLDSFTFDDIDTDEISKVSIIYGNNLELTFKEDKYIELLDALAETNYTKTNEQIEVPNINLSYYNFGQINLIIDLNDQTELFFKPKRGSTKINDYNEVTITEITVTTNCSHNGYDDKQSARYISDNDSLITTICDLLSNELPYIKYYADDRFYVEPVKFENDDFTINKTNKYRNECLRKEYWIDDNALNHVSYIIDNAFDLMPKGELISDENPHTLTLKDRFSTEYAITYIYWQKSE